MEDPLNLESRRRIYELISRRPGSYLREMERELDMKSGLLSYHLDYMEKRGLIRSEDDGFRRRYFPAEDFRLRDRRIISLLRQDSPRKILMHLLINQVCSFTEILDEMAVAKSTLSYHLKKLTRAGVVVVERKEKEKVYRVEDPDGVADLLISLRESFEGDAVDRFADIWRKLGSR